MRQSTERQWNGWSLAWGLMVTTSGSVDVVSVSVVDLSGVEVSVGGVVVDLVVMDGTIEGISEWIVVDVLGTRSNSWVVVLVVVRTVVLEGGGGEEVAGLTEPESSFSPKRLDKKGD
jgi:hypothetical protein